MVPILGPSSTPRWSPLLLSSPLPVQVLGSSHPGSVSVGTYVPRLGGEEVGETNGGFPTERPLVRMPLVTRPSFEGRSTFVLPLFFSRVLVFGSPRPCPLVRLSFVCRPLCHFPRTPVPSAKYTGPRVEGQSHVPLVDQRPSPTTEW